MFKNFTEEHWINTINIGDKSLLGIIYTFDNPIPTDTLLQVYAEVNENEFHLLGIGNNFNVVIKNNEIIISNDKPFKGKVVIK